MTVDEAKALIGKRVEIPVHYDLWMRGAKYGKVTGFQRSNVPGISDALTVKMDHPQVKRTIKVWALDWDYMRIL
jgi:hypothetical protein